MCGAVFCVSKTMDGDAFAKVMIRAIAALRSTVGLNKYVNNVGGEYPGGGLANRVSKGGNGCANIFCILCLT